MMVTKQANLIFETICKCDNAVCYMNRNNKFESHRVITLDSVAESVRECYMKPNKPSEYIREVLASNITTEMKDMIFLFKGVRVCSFCWLELRLVGLTTFRDYMYFILNVFMFELCKVHPKKKCNLCVCYVFSQKFEENELIETSKFKRKVRNLDSFSNYSKYGDSQRNDVNTFMNYFGDKMGEHMPHKSVIRIPMTNKKYLYGKYFIPYCMNILERTKDTICSFKYFCKLIRADHRNFKFTDKQRFSVCQTCFNLNTQIKEV